MKRTIKKIEYVIRENWGACIVTRYTNDAEATIVAKFCGDGYENNFQKAKEFVKEQNHVNSDN